jgi:hypothetical protein
MEKKSKSFEVLKALNKTLPVVWDVTTSVQEKHAASSFTSRSPEDGLTALQSSRKAIFSPGSTPYTQGQAGLGLGAFIWSFVTTNM